MCNILVTSFATMWSQDKKISEKFSGSFRKHWEQLHIKSVQHLFAVGKLHFLLLKFYDVCPEIFRNVPLSEKISEIWQNCQKYFPGDFSPEEISPGKLSGIYWNKTLVYSRKFTFFKHVTSLQFHLRQVGHRTKKFPKSFPEVSGNIGNNFRIKAYNTCFQSVNCTFYYWNLITFTPKFSEMFPCRKKFLKFDKIVRSTFRGIFLQRKFPQGNFPDLLK